MSLPEQASYVYAVARPLTTDGLNGLSGVGGHPVHVVGEDDLVAVVSTVPLNEFDEDALRANLEHLDWLEETARAHHAVVEVLSGAATTVPLRLATVYRDEGRVREVLRQDHAMFDAVLRRLSGRAEYSVKVYADPAERAAAATPPEPEPGESPGKAYLRKRREQRERQDDTWRVATDLCESTDTALGAWVEARAQHRPQDASLAGVPGENVMNLAYLVAAERVGPFLSQVRRLQEHAPAGTRVEVSGPWAPYSFASPEPDGGRV